MHKVIASVLKHPYFEYIVLSVIVLNALTLGFETYPSIEERYGGLLHIVDACFIAFFLLELTAKIYVQKASFFSDGWNIFDGLIVTVTMLPFAGNISVLRAFRIIRALRLVSFSPALRRVVSAILNSVRGFAAVLLLLTLVSYIYAVMASELFGAANPVYFGDVGKALFTLFQILTLDAWSDIARPLMEVYPYAGVFFISYITITVFMLLSIVVGIAANAIEKDADDAALADK